MGKLYVVLNKPRIARKNIMKNLMIDFIKATFTICLLGFALGASFSTYAGEYCFGAVGQGCGMFSGGPLGSVATCIPNLPGARKDTMCQVSGGSMAHDPCCAAHPNGEWCGGSPSTSQCSAEWDRAVNRFVWGYNWKRNVDSKKENTTGNVVLNDYCAPATARVHKNDVNQCCSRKADPAPFWLRVGRPSLYICHD
jgi:hypothetical protein